MKTFRRLIFEVPEFIEISTVVDTDSHAFLREVPEFIEISTVVDFFALKGAGILFPSSSKFLLS